MSSGMLSSFLIAPVSSTITDSTSNPAFSRYSRYPPQHPQVGEAYTVTVDSFLVQAPSVPRVGNCAPEAGVEEELGVEPSDPPPQAAANRARTPPPPGGTST